MRKSTIVLDFLKFAVANKIVFGRTVLAQMSALTVFVNPDVPYTEGTAIINKLEGFYMASRTGDHEQVALMHQAETEFNDYFRKMANYVNRTADGNDAIILSSGFHLAKQPVPSDRPEFTVEAGDALGSILLKRKAADGAYSYVWQYYVGSEAPADDIWLLAGSTTQTSYLITGLTPGTKVWFRVAVVTPAGMQPFTAPISKFIS
jgi:hypothetical protein